MRASYLYLLSMLTNHSYRNNDYEELNDEEKLYLDSTNKMLFHESENIKNASFRIMLLSLKVCSSLGTDDELSQEEIDAERDEIKKDLNEEEKDLLEAFEWACIQTIGIYSEEAKRNRELRNEMIRRLRKEMNNNE